LLPSVGCRLTSNNSTCQIIISRSEEKRKTKEERSIRGSGWSEFFKPYLVLEETKLTQKKKLKMGGKDKILGYFGASQIE